MFRDYMTGVLMWVVTLYFAMRIGDTFKRGVTRDNVLLCVVFVCMFVAGVFMVMCSFYQ